MGRFIEIDVLKDRNISEWIIPYNLLLFDRREQRWPNDLFPYSHTIGDFYTQTAGIKIQIRRFCEQLCQGDIAVEKFYTNNGYRLLWKFWFELDTDHKLFYDAWNIYIEDQ